MTPTERRRTALVLALLVLASVGGSADAANPTVPPAAPPTVAELLAACARGAAHGNQGVDAASCEWFAIPCGCKPGQVGSDLDRWCLPPAEPTATTVRNVIAELRRVPDRTLPIDQVLPGILARLYPCRPGGDG